MEPNAVIVPLVLSSTGHVTISTKSHRGVFRVKYGEKIFFKFQQSIKNACKLFIVDIRNRPVFELEQFMSLNGTTFLYTILPWTPSRPGPYRICNGRENFVDEYCSSIVDSTIVVNCNPRLRLNDIRMLSVMPRRIGKISEWPKNLKSAVIEKGYNSIHFTPMQKLGPSNSSYSIADVLSIDNLVLSEDSSSSDDWEQLANHLRLIPNEPLLFTDIVLNHASSVGSWAIDCPEATYCLADCPYLTCAAELDQGLAGLISKYSDDTFFPIQECMHAIRVYLEKFNFSEFFQLDVAGCVGLFRLSPLSTPTKNTDPWQQTLEQVGTSRTRKILVDFRSVCSTETELWKNIHVIEVRLENLAKECFWESLSALESTIRYNISSVPKKFPIIPRYFSNLSKGDLALNNGWVMNWPAGVDFAAPGHHLVFMKRHVVAWGDCLKLRYDREKEGKVWQVMEKYCGKIASIFDGVRIDNCHSTPLFVLKRLVDGMRKINPHIVIMAELFTGEAGNDSVFESSIGIDLLVREGMQISCGQEIVYKLWDVSQESVGSGFSLNQNNFITKIPSSCILYDSTHDNSTVLEKFGDVRNALPLAVSVAFSPSAIGSSVGFDSLANIMPSVVCSNVDVDLKLLGISENEFYSNNKQIWIRNFLLNEYQPVTKVEVYGEWDDWKSGIELIREKDIWVLPYLPTPSFSQYKFVVNQTKWICNRFVGINRIGNNVSGTVGNLNEMKRLLNRLHNELNECDYGQFFSKILQPNLIELKRMNKETLESVVAIVSFANTACRVQVDLDTEYDYVDWAYQFTISEEGTTSDDFCSHQLVVLSEKDLSLEVVSDDRRQLLLEVPEFSAVLMRTRGLRNFFNPSKPPLDELDSPSDYSHILFTCDAEEPTYEVPGWGKLIYAGLAGLEIPIRSFNSENAFLGSAIAENIRNGDWLFDYTVSRFSRYPKLFHWFNTIIRPHYVSLPSGMKPKFFFELFLQSVYDSIVEKLLCFHQSCGDRDGLVSRLTIATFQFTARPTVAAGLPFFSSGYMRCWGRDTFIAFKGMFLLTNRFEEGRRIILDFAQVVRHGLIPNLFDDGSNPRYNARDACWFFLNAICDYIEKSGDEEILAELVTLKYPEAVFSYTSSVSSLPLLEIVQGILMSHYRGIDFVEWNAGPSIDSHMTTEGFHVEIFVNKMNGLVYGGNMWNCGTWMDKMGSDYENKGRPATPRWGAAVEINGIALRVLEFFVGTSDSGRLNHNQDLYFWWSLASENFGKSFFTGENGFVKDVIGGDIVEENRFRPNACIALANVPLSVVDKVAAQEYLRRCDEILRGPLGMRTLPSTDPAYNGVYDNSDPSGGYNYHNGPEWLWLYGCFIVACRRFDVYSREELVEMLEAHELHIRDDPWRSLPELTNMNGRHCEFSCPAQAWSVCCLLEAISNLTKCSD